MFDDLKPDVPLHSLPDAVAHHPVVSIASLIFACLPNLVRLSLAQYLPPLRRIDDGFNYTPLERLQVLNVAYANISKSDVRAMLRSAPNLRGLIAPFVRNLQLDALPASVEEIDVVLVDIDLDPERVRRTLPRLRRLVYRVPLLHMHNFGLAPPHPSKVDIPDVECVCYCVLFLLFAFCLMLFRNSGRAVKNAY